MNIVSSSSLTMSVFLFLVFSFSLLASAYKHDDFLQCLYQHEENSSNISKVAYTSENSSYLSVLQFSIRNPRFNTSAMPKPLVIVTPTNVSHIQATVLCSRQHDLQIRIRSGGHDLEGLSYVSNLPFVVLDLINLRNITVDVESKTAWVQSGSTLGELYYQIAEKSRTLAFPAGACSTVGVGGYFSGGGYGYLFRSFGLAADHVVDAILIDVHGRMLDRASMGEDLFWAIRGGGGNTYGIVIAWKVNLVEVPPVVTVFTIQRTLEQGALNLVNQWQYVAHKLPNEIDLRVFISSSNTTQDGKTMIVVSFTSLYLGRVDLLMKLLQQDFPELGLLKTDCIEMSWIESTVYIAGFTNYSSLDQMLDRTPLPQFTNPFKEKADYAREAIPKVGLEGLFQWFYKIDANAALVTLIPYGGQMNKISDTSIPFPHRAGTMFKILYIVNLPKDPENRMNWIREVYKYMTPYVSKNPRSTYVNYRDLDIGKNNDGYKSYQRARIWGVKYFGKNFDRLVRIKTNVDPDNFFRNEQSVPPLSKW